MLRVGPVTFIATLLAASVPACAQAGNLVEGARVSLVPPAPATEAAAQTLADLASEQWVGWEPAPAGDLHILVEWDGWAPLDVVACHWRHMPARYSVEVRVAGGWERVAQVAGNAVRDHKIALHQFPTARARALRLLITEPLEATAGVSLRALEAYAKADPPAPVAAFLARETPQLLESRDSIRRWRIQQAGLPLDEELLAREIPAWEPIPASAYGGQETGRVVNERSAAHGALRAELCARYAQTGRREYAERAWDVLATLIDHYDRWQAFRFVGRDWQAVTFQEPGYLLSSLPQEYERIAEALDNARKLRVLYFLLDVADFQYRAILEFTPLPDQVTSRSDLYNWVPNSIGGLAMTSVMLREFPQAAGWIAACDERFPGFFKDVFFLPDGTWWECSPAHHVYVLRGLYPYALAKHLLGEPIWEQRYYGLSLADTFEALAKTATPLGEYPSLNDSTGSDAPMRSEYGSLVEAATIMRRGDILAAWQAQPRWPDIPTIRPRSVTVAPPEYTSVNLAAAGMAVMRDGWDTEDAWLLLDYGPHGGSHGQLDKLGVIMFDDGHQWLPDAGCAPHYSIFPEQWSWHRQTIAHNTVLVDDRSQEPTEGRLIAWHSEDALDFVCAEHDGYPSGEGPMTIAADEETTLTIRPRELTPFRVALVELVSDSGERTVLVPEAATLAGAQVVEDAGAPQGRAIEFREPDATASWAVAPLAGPRQVRVFATGRAGSQDSIWVDLGNARIGQVDLPDRVWEWVEGVGGGATRHRRAVVHPRGEYFLIHDTVTASDGGSHLAEFLLHVYGEPAGQQPGRLLFRHGELGLAVCSPLIGAEPVTIEQGLCGGLQRDRWRGEGYPGKGDPGWLYIPWLRLPTRLTPEAPRADLFVVVQAFRGLAPPELRVEEVAPADGLGVGLRITMGETEDLYRSPASGGGTARFVRTRAGQEVLRRDLGPAAQP
ncbi:MAG: heparinase II/III family protein [Armatimonadota bacterium]